MGALLLAIGGSAAFYAACRALPWVLVVVGLVVSTVLSLAYIAAKGDDKYFLSSAPPSLAARFFGGAAGALAGGVLTLLVVLLVRSAGWTVLQGGAVTGLALGMLFPRGSMFVARGLLELLPWPDLMP